MLEVPTGRTILSMMPVRMLCAWRIVRSCVLDCFASVFSGGACALLRACCRMANLLAQAGESCRAHAATGAAPDASSGIEDFLVELDRLRDKVRRPCLSAGQLRTEHELFQAAVSNIPVGVGMFDINKCLIMCNQSYRDLYSVPDHLAVPGTHLKAMLDHRVSLGNFEGHDKEAYVASLMKLVEEKDPVVRKAELADGRIIRIKQKQVDGIGWISMHEDITEAARAEAMVAHMARHDALTALPNRVALGESISKALERLEEGGSAALLSIDLDRFKLVNDTLGHPVGDALLRAVADRLRATVREGDTVARFGGDEFSIVQERATQPHSAHALAQRIVQGMSEPFDIDGHVISIGASVGIAIAPMHGASADELFKFADAALYRAKDEGRGRAHCFEATQPFGSPSHTSGRRSAA